MTDTSFFNKNGTPPNDPVRFTTDDHSQLQNLGNDDHVQYHNDDRGDSRYYTKAIADGLLGLKAQAVHTHVVANITDLPATLATKSDVGHTHVSTDITDFQEATHDSVAGLLKPGTGVGLVYDDASNALTINVSPGIGTGDTIGPAGALDGNLPLFLGSTGKILQDSGFSPASFVSSARAVNTGTGLTGGGTLTVNRTLSLTNTTVTPGNYSLASISVDAQGRLTSAASGALTVNATSTSGGSAGNILFDSGSVIQEDGYINWNSGTKTLQLATPVIGTANPSLLINQIWNNAATTFSPLVVNITDTASAAASKLFDLQTGGASRFSVTKAGAVTAASTITSTGTISTSGNLNVGVAQQVAWTGRAILTSPATGCLQFGAADSTLPVAQTLCAQSVLTGGATDQAGVNLTIQGSAGTGAGVGGSIIFQTAPAGTTGTTKNTLVTAMTIAGTGAISTTNSFTVGGQLTATTNIIAGASSTIGWSGRGVMSSPAVNDVQIGPPDAAAPVAQIFGPQSVVAGTTNTAGPNFTICGAQGTGTGAGGNIILATAPAGTTGTAQNLCVPVLTIRSDRTIGLPTFTVATLPAASSAGRIAVVTDATSRSWDGTLTGGGTVVSIVLDTGSSWITVQ